MTITPEQKFYQEIWWLLQEIKEEILAFGEGKPIKYNVVKLVAAGIPSQERQKNLLHRLQEWKAIKIVNESPPEWKSNGKHWFELKILQPKFNKIYKKYEKKNKLIRIKLQGEDVSSHFGFDGMVFKLKRVDNTYAVINFYPTEDKRPDTYCLMYALVAILKREYKRDGEWIRVIASREKIYAHIKEECPKKTNIDSDWLKNTRSNLNNKIPKEYKGLIKIGYYDRKLKGYLFSLKIPF